MNRLKFPKILLGLSALGFLLILISTADGSGVICDFLAHPSIVSKCDPVLIEDQESSMLSHNNRNKELQCSQRPVSMLEIDSSKMGLDFLKDIPMPALCSVRIINVSKAEVGLEILLEFWRLRQTTGSFVYLIALPSGLGPKEFVTQPYKVSDFYHMFFVSDYGGQHHLHVVCPHCNEDHLEEVSALKTSVDLLPRDRFDDFKGDPVRLSYTRIETAILSKLDTTKPASTDNLYGSEYSLIKFIAKGMNFKIKWILSKGQGEWGAKIGTEWTGAIGDLDENNADLAIGAITITAARSEAVDFSIQYSEEKIGLLSQIPFALPKWKAIFWPFEVAVWFGIVISFLLFGPFYYFYLEFTNDGIGLDLLTCTMHSAKTLCMQSVGVWPVSMSAKLMITFWSFYSFIVVIAYSGSLMSSLTLPARSNPIDSFEDLLYSDFHHFVIQNNSLIHTTFEKSTDPFFKAIWDKVKRQGMDKSVLPVTNYTLIMQNQEMVLADDLSYVKLRVRLEFTTRSGESVLHAGGKGVYPSGLGIPMRKNAPYASAVNKWIVTANEFGLQKYWLDQAIIQTIRLRRKFKNEDLDTMRQVENKLKAIEENAKNRKLTMDHMQGPFYLVFSGALIGCLAFLLEHLSSVCSRDKK